jgi:hypothetical protein
MTDGRIRRALENLELQTSTSLDELAKISAGLQGLKAALDRLRRTLESKIEVQLGEIRRLLRLNQQQNGEPDTPVSELSDSSGSEPDGQTATPLTGTPAG